ncbi:pilus assembly protein TadG-related protein [Brevundimonas sp.]|uniref:pilus assembly protein TadG-related protein n=1 Tax=Brevundimonas sp. TaxID=1871086 RepID=UPI002FCCB38F
MNSFTGRFMRLLQRFTRSQQGNVAMIAGVALPVLLMISAGAIDLHNAAKVKSELQDALDAATLAAARSTGTTNAEVQKIGMASLKANMPQYFLTNPGDVASFTVNAKYEVQATATVQVKTIIANVFLPPYGQLFDDYLPMGASSNVLRASRNVEVAMALDVTGSMKDYMSDLRSAAKELVGIVVQGDQKLFTTRVALVPYAAGVNMDGLADITRSSLVGTVAVDGVNWLTKASPITNISSGTFTANAHGLEVGQSIYLSGISGNANSLNNKVRTVTSVTTNTFRVNNFTSSGNTGSSSVVSGCRYASCHVGVEAKLHGVDTGEYVTISSVQGMTGLNATFTGTRIDKDTFSVPLVGPEQRAYSRAGTVMCRGDGCQNRLFDNILGRQKTLPTSTCVSERPRRSAPGGALSAASDAVPSADNWLGRAYLESGNACPTATFVPLTNDSKTLTDSINGYRHGGSTAGQVGIELAWYAISPTFGSIFPKDNQPNVFDRTKTIKAVVLMTDGEFNTPFCRGIIAKNAGSGSGDDAAKINCNATNGNGFAQSVQLCDAMREQGIIVYTVGFNLGGGRGGSGIDTAYEVMEYCATDKKENFFPAADGTDLKEAFKQIGRDITRLRIAR